MNDPRCLPIKKRIYKPDFETSSPQSCSSYDSTATVTSSVENHQINSSPDTGHSDRETSSSSCFSCYKCSKTFLAENSLRIHVRRHMNKSMGRYMCDVCGQTFSQKSGQISHLRIHTKEKPFQCDVCDKHFSDFSTFTKHKRVHSGEKPYSCSVCFRNFSQSGNLHRHFRVIHMKNL